MISKNSIIFICNICHNSNEDQIKFLVIEKNILSVFLRVLFNNIHYETNYILSVFIYKLLEYFKNSRNRRISKRKLLSIQPL
jgi:hypothetical protein